MERFPVSAQKREKLQARMRQLGVRVRDLEESFVRSSGPGGQHVNKSATCVLLIHRPTGLRVRCQSERSQALNRFLARRRLLDKVERHLKGLVSAEQERIAKIRRQKSRRSRRTRLKILADKRLQGARKTLRGPIHPHQVKPD